MGPFWNEWTTRWQRSSITSWTLTLTFAPDDERATVAVSATAKTTLAPTNPAVTSLYLTGQEGSAQAVEMVPQVPGQTSLDLEEQEVPSELKIIRFA